MSDLSTGISPTNRVRLLDDITANRIAAGEVVERPASAVKELVENAIDAGATRIAILLEEGGKRLIEVQDNGHGMSEEDAVLGLQRHATSKIRTSDDLFAIRTLGFRGEALPSIASVSRFSLQTKAREGAEGTRLLVVGGELHEAQQVGAPDGTVVRVEDLFYNTPARLKFLKSTSAELSRSVECVAHLAIAHPEIAFRVTHGLQELLNTPGNGQPIGAFTAVWGRDIARKLVPISFHSPGLSVSGHLCTPDTSRASRAQELFFVNGRPIKSRLLAHALEDACRSFTPDSRYPIAAIFVEIDPGSVDVNVHPTKSEVKFNRDGEVHHAVSQAVKRAIGEHGVLPTLALREDSGVATEAASLAPDPSSSEAMRVHEAQTAFQTTDFRGLSRFAPPTSFGLGSTEMAAAGLLAGIAKGMREPGTTDGADATFRESGERRPFAEQLRGFRVLGQAKNTYIVAITDQGIAFIDQHVAHERVLYERLTERRARQGTPTQHLVVPFSVSLGLAEAALLEQRLGDFAEAGWELESFGKGAYLVRSVPIYAAKRNHEALLRDMIDELVHQSVSRRLLVQKEHVTITNACKMAVKAGDPMNMPEMVGLLEQLAETENPYLCPHGRPIVVTVPFIDIDRKFKRA